MNGSCTEVLGCVLLPGEDTYFPNRRHDPPTLAKLATSETHPPALGTEFWLDLTLWLGALGAGRPGPGELGRPARPSRKTPSTTDTNCKL
jgi:hypothetical protein